MRITDNIQVIIEKVENDDLADLYTAAFYVTKQGSFECFKNHVSGHYYIKCNYLYDTLLLKDHETKVNFLVWVQNKIADSGRTQLKPLFSPTN